jgi:hypothetical protein
MQEHFRIPRRFRQQGRSHGIAADFTLDPNLTTNPPSGGVEEQHGLDNSLQQISDEIVPPNVSQLMSQNGVKFLCR